MPRSVVVLLAHPRVGSLNHALADRVVATLRARDLRVDFHDLYAEGFDPVLRPEEAFTSGSGADRIVARSADPLLDQHRQQLAGAAALVVVHPNWWGKPPAILAGWLDRVLVPGVAYRLDSGGGAPVPLLTLAELLVINTSDTPADREDAVFGDPLAAIWRRCIAPYVGDPRVDRVVFRVVAEADGGQRAAWLDDVGQRAERLLS